LILVDASVWIQYFNGALTRETDKLDALLAREPLVVGDLTLTEVLQGFSSAREFNQAHELLTSLLLIQLCDPELAIQAAKNFRFLRKRGVTVRKTIDTIIATRCIESGLDLLHDDKDFEPFAKYLGLRTVS
jgi:predicted nucleic acid-binding protein